MSSYREVLLALAAGVLLVAMISFNSQLAKASTPLFASWAAHAIGTLVSILFLFSLARWFPAPNPSKQPVPIWAYAGGLVGAMIVVVATLAVNSPLGLAGTLALSLVGQIGFSLLADQFGWLGLAKRQLTHHDLISTLLILSGSLLIIFFRG